MPSIAELQLRAVELMKTGNFGPDALDVNLEITRAAPDNEGAWTRLGRCYLEQRRFADAAGALATALELNPSNSVAKSLLSEVTKRRAMALPTPESGTGFSGQDFHALGHLAPVSAGAALGPKIETLLMALNEQRTAARIVEARNRAGQAGGKLYHRNSYHTAEKGHIYAYHHGGRWEPQFSLGIYSDTAFGANALRAGLGFDMSQSGRSPEPASGQEQVLGFFELFQQQLATTWRGNLVDWMAGNAGFIQVSGRPPATDMMPGDAVDWLINCRNPATIGWVFVGRWLFLDRPDDAAILGDMRGLVASVEDTFAALFPLWVGTYRE